MFLLRQLCMLMPWLRIFIDFKRYTPTIIFLEALLT